MRRAPIAFLSIVGAVAVQSCGSTTDSGSHAATNGGTGGIGVAGSGAALPVGGSASSASGGMPSGGTGGHGGSAGPSAGEGGVGLGEAGVGGAPSHSAFVWQLSYGQSYAAHVAADSQGAAIVSGTVFDTEDVTLGSTTLKSHGGADVMLSRVLATGAPAWAKV